MTINNKYKNWAKIINKHGRDFLISKGLKNNEETGDNDPCINVSVPTSFGIAEQSVSFKTDEALDKVFHMEDMCDGMIEFLWKTVNEVEVQNG